jgi:hypothetical protein
MKSVQKSLAFLFLLIGIYFYIGVFKTLPLRPQSVHQWAQCDRASVALNFGEDTFNFFKPRVHNTNNGSGITGMEFPMMNYLAGMLFRLFGNLDFFYRLLMMITITAGLVAAFKMAIIQLNNFAQGVFAVLFMSLSPILVFYTPNYLPDTASLGLILISWYYFFQFRTTQHQKYLAFLLVLGSLACLMKITSLISILTMIGITGIEMFSPSYFGAGQLQKKNKLKALAGLTGVILVTALWYAYAKWLSAVNHSGLFLLQTKIPGSMNEVKDNLEYIDNLWRKQYYSQITYYAIAVTGIVIAYFHKHAKRLDLAITISLWLGAIGFFFIMLGQFRDHDYYIIALLPALLFQAITFFKIVNSLQGPAGNQITRFAALIFTIITLNAVVHCKDNYRERYHPESWMKSPPVYINYFDLADHVKSVGVVREKRTISAFDWSPNITLYLLDIKGLCISPEWGPGAVVSELKKGGDFLILNDSTLLTNEEIKPYLSNKLSDKNGIHIFKL